MKKRHYIKLRPIIIDTIKSIKGIVQYINDGS